MRVKARSPNGQPITAYSRSDGERIIEAQQERTARRDANIVRKNPKKANEIAHEIGTSDRSDVMTIHEVARILCVSRARGSKIARRLEGKLGIRRVEARAPGTQRIIAYMRSDGERLINLFKETCAAQNARRSHINRSSAAQLSHERQPGMWVTADMGI